MSKTFNEVFQSNLPEEKRNSLLASILGIVGDSSLVEVTNSVETALNRATDITNLSYSSLLNYLAFLGSNVPSIIPSNASLTLQALNKSTFTVGEQFTDLQNNTWVVGSDLTIEGGRTGVLQLNQELNQAYETLYSSYIQVEITGVVSDSIRVFIRGIELKRAEKMTNGYLAYVTGSTLFVKIYQGVDTINPENETVTVSYTVSEGDLSENPIFDVSSWRTGLTLDSLSFSNGADTPSQESLQAILKTDILTRTSLVRKSDYENFVLQDTRIAECFVAGDFERRSLTGIVNPTGTVDIYAINTDLETIPISLQNEIFEEMLPYKDISIIQFKNSIPYHIRVYVFYTSVIGLDVNFEGSCTIEVSRSFDYTQVRLNNDSLYNNLDISEIITRVQNTAFDPSFLAIRFAYENDYTVLSGAIASSYPLYSVQTLERGAVGIWYEDKLYATTETTDDTDVYELVRVSDGTILGKADYRNAIIEFNNIEGKDMDIKIIVAVQSVDKVTTPNVEYYRLLSGVGYYKGEQPLNIERLPF